GPGPVGVRPRFTDRPQPGLEAQLCHLAGERACTAHDIDDGVRSELVTMERLEGVELFGRFRRQATSEHPQVRGRRVLYEAIRRMLSTQVYDVIATTRTALERVRPEDANAARRSAPLVAFSDGMAKQSAALKHFLLHNLYRHPQVMAVTGHAKEIVADLFAAYTKDPAQMPADFAARADTARS